MQQLFDVIRHNPLWNGIDHSDFERMSPCLETITKRFSKGDDILRSGDPLRHIGLILSGGVRVIKEGIDGNVLILAELGAPELFGEVFACAGVAHSPVTVQASEASEILFMNYRRIISTCSSACGFHGRMVENMLVILAKKTMLLNQKIDILSQRTTREKILAFLDAQRGAGKQVTIPFNREEMARYLNVDRSALSNELRKMQDVGLIRFHRNVFELLQTDKG